ncbi:SusC/RagA family TonB-linked outer membrane protein [Sphingobacterium griseoflavum]|uniref:SusC/RagA family TonB-linked outer membrane protein n=1 Tax=Sphingobacterium griseoflavum TaxID=1474952 RepID=A0ABQ3HTR5_9SPHI|nr:TonB-dependent receptor [Sphingobacterium griseoflavum]GHE33474.1 SusC/RagA family TonB-linked outer membrane protein [Sphingobacterium griseoflavum]
MNTKLLTSLCIMACSATQIAYAQQTALAGKVTDATGLPVSGVTIHVKGSQNGTSTNESGLFTLPAPSNGILVISAVGYATQEIPIDGKRTVQITLSPDDTALDEVMVVAYGTAKKSTYTGSAATVTPKEIENQPITSFESALNGRVAGLQVSTASGQAGATSNIRIRGIGSMNASNEPLYVIDGVPVISGNVGQMSGQLYATSNVMSTLNPADIASITVLKDAAASSLYGSRAANGVIVITTKRGKTGKPVVSVRSSLGITPSWATDNYEVADPQAQINMEYQIFHDYRTSNRNNATGVNYTDQEASTYALNQINNRFNKHGYRFEVDDANRMSNVRILGMEDGIENRAGRYFDWEDYLFRTGVFQTNDLSLSGGTENTKYYSSLSYTTDKGRAIINEYERIAGRVNLHQRLSKRVEYNVNLNVANTDKTGFNDTRSTGSNPFFQSRNLLFPFYWPTDYKTGDPWTAQFGSLAFNSDYYNNHWDNNTRTLKLGAVQSLSWEIIPGFTAKTIFSFDNTAVTDDLYYAALHFNGATDRGSASKWNTNIRKYVSSNTLTYTKTVDSHHISLLAGYEAEKNSTDYQFSNGVNLGSSTSSSIGTGANFRADSDMWGNNLMSSLGRIDYNYDERYFAGASIRRDGSSRFHPDSRWGTFWSVSGAWSLHKEAFLTESTLVSTLRLRASYGVNGTLPNANFAWRTLMYYKYNYKGSPGGLVSDGSLVNIDKGLGNTLLTWEKSNTYDLALEFGFFQNRLTGSVEYFNRDSKDLLQDVPTSGTTGFARALQNVGVISNSGIELDLGGDLVRKENLSWSLRVNAAFLSSRVKSLDAGNDILWNDPTGGDGRAQFIYREGESVLAFYGYEWAGVNPENGRNVWYTNNETIDFDFNGRAATYSYSKASQIIIGSAVPRVYGGINSDFSYKSISLGLNFAYKIGGKLYDGAEKDVNDDGYYWERIRSQQYYDNMWSPNNPTGSQPKIDGNDLTDAIQFSSRHIYDASFLRLKNINVAYTLPSTLTQRAKISNARLFFNGTNLLTTAAYKMADPEVGQFGTRGWETPLGKTYTFGIELNF